MYRNSFVYFGFALLGMCAIPAQSQVVTHRAKLSDTTEFTLATDFAIERAGRPTPRLGLSLAGGGTRAGHFAHGVLQGLHDQGVLDKVDAISSVSGGSYAAYWYFSRLLEAKRQGTSKDAMFADCLPTWWVQGNSSDAYASTLNKLMQLAQSQGSPRLPVCSNPQHWEPGDPYRYQAHLARWPDVFRESPTRLSGNAQGAPTWETAKLIAATWFEFPLGFVEGTATVPAAYRYGIERTWGLIPSPREADAKTSLPNEKTAWRYTNMHGEKWHWDLRVDTDMDSWDSLKAAMESDQQFPLWILNTTQGKKKKGQPNPNHIYELTALSHGSDGQGFLAESPRAIGVESLGHGTAASAAFADAQGVSSDVIGSAMAIHKALQWGIDVENHFGSREGKKSSKLHLSDGGGSENMGLYSLIRRGIPDIIVVDEAQDVAGRMEDLCWVREALRKDGLVMEFKKLERFEEVCATHFKGSKNSPIMAYNTSAWLSPVIEGTVTWPLRADGTRQPTTRLWLIKLAWNQQDFRRAFRSQECGTAAHPVNCLLTVYYAHNTVTTNPKDGYMVFPQLTTTGATFNSSSYLFWAYRELGRMLTKNLVWSKDDGGRLRLDEGVQQCCQPVFRVTKDTGRRPHWLPSSEKVDACCVVE